MRHVKYNSTINYTLVSLRELFLLDLRYEVKIPRCVYRCLRTRREKYLQDVNHKTLFKLAKFTVQWKLQTRQS